jgi:FkbM family methyltransferase
MRHQLARLLYPYGSTRRVLRGPAKGMRLVVEPGVGLSYVMGTDASAPRFFSRVITPGMTIFDVGANKGQMALLFAALVGSEGRVIAIEPAPLEFASLERNLQLNGLSNVTALQMAASEHSGDIQFFYSPENPTQGKLSGVEPSYRTDGSETLNVRARSLDSLADEYGSPDVVKIDVEGAAGAALRGARHLVNGRAPSFYLELHGPEEQAAVRDELMARGYVATTMGGEAIADPTAGWFSPLWCWKPNRG